MERKLKDSGIPWIGQIPEHWEVNRAKGMFNHEQRPVRDCDGVITCFRDGEVTLRINRRTEGFTESIQEFGYQGIRKGDLVIHQMDAFAGSIGISDSDGKGSPILICLTPNGDYINKYYCSLLRVMASQGWIRALYKGIRERSTDFRYDTFSQQYLPVPPMWEQERIAEWLDVKCDEIDELIEVEQQMIADLEAHRQSVITEAVTHGLNPDAPLRDSGIQWIGQLPEHWKIKKLKFSCSIKGRIGFRGYTNDDIVQEGEGAITLSPSNMKNGKMDYSKLTYLSWDKYFESPEIMIENGNLLMVKTGSTFGKMAYVESLPMEATINPQIIVIKDFKDCPRFILYSMMSKVGKSNIALSVVGGTIPTIAQEKILNYELCIPPHSEQVEIADYLDAKCAEIDALIKVKQDKIETLKEYRQSMIFEAVTGKTQII